MFPFPSVSGYNLRAALNTNFYYLCDLFLFFQVEAHLALLAEEETPKYPPISGRDYLLYNNMLSQPIS